jgi:hypothetical protein
MSRQREWCPVCCSPIDGPTHACPGSLLATGHERHGWRVHVETPHGLQAFGVLVAPCHETWRARILTYPNILWAVPGGGGSIKFVGRTAEEAERHAIAFIEEHCREKNYLRRDQLDPVEVERISEEAGPRSRPRRHQASKRKACFLPVRFGSERARRKGTTVNLSREGMFIGTPAPLEAGASIRLRLEANGSSVPLRGIVIWNRRRPEAGRPLGMGVRLVDPAPAYPRFVDALV